MTVLGRMHRSTVLGHVGCLMILLLAQPAAQAQELSTCIPAEQRTGKHLLDEGTKMRTLADFMLVRPPRSTKAAIRSPWAYSSLGLFCKMDVQFERHLPIPLFMRLGDVRHEVDWERGTGSGWKP